MSANTELERVTEWHGLRGFANLLHKENRAWWGTRRWWINAILWSGMLGGLVVVMLFMLPTVAAATGDPAVAAAGGPLPFGLQMARSIFFEMGSMALALGAIVLSQDLILAEKHSGVTEWLLAKPVARRSYVLAKLSAAIAAVLLLLIALPALVTYLLFFVRLGSLYPFLPFLSGVGIMAVHTLFYLTLTLMLGTFFDSRAPILGIALGVAMGGSLIGGLIQELMYVMPWSLGKMAALIADSQPVPAEMLWSPLVASLLWSVVFTVLALVKFERIEF
ncbi:MAG: ABC transporter permease subunit [Chloroflexi bacterium]|nr:ABC transporter permease subunit [Chloroflexota bacterium]